MVKINKHLCYVFYLLLTLKAKIYTIPKTKPNVKKVSETVLHVTASLSLTPAPHLHHPGGQSLHFATYTVIFTIK